MSTREELKKFVSLYLKQRFITDEMPDDECDSETEFIFRYLDSQGIRLPDGSSLIKEESSAMS